MFSTGLAFSSVHQSQQHLRLITQLLTHGSLKNTLDPTIESHRLPSWLVAGKKGVKDSLPTYPESSCDGKKHTLHGQCVLLLVFLWFPIFSLAVVVVARKRGEAQMWHLVGVRTVSDGQGYEAEEFSDTAWEELSALDRH